MYGHIEKLAREVVKGLERSGVHAKLFQVAETLPTDVLEKMHAPPKNAVSTQEASWKEFSTKVF